MDGMRFETCKEHLLLGIIAVLMSRSNKTEVGVKIEDLTELPDYDIHVTQAPEDKFSLTVTMEMK